MAAVTYQTLYDRYKDDSAILRMEKYAYWSLPTIFADPDLRTGKQQAVQRDYQSVGAMLTNSLSSKMTALLFPSNQSFFRLDSTQHADVLSQGLGVTSEDLTASLATLENTAYRRIFLKASYHQLMHAMKLLIATGNTLLYRDSAGTTMHAYSLRQYSLLRDGTGKVLDIILKERTTVDQLPAGVRSLFANREENAPLVLYTRIKRKYNSVVDSFVVSQQIEGHDIGDPSEYPEPVCPYIPATWNLVTGENYGRGLVEDYAGDFAKLSELSEALALYEIEACRVLHMAKPGGGVDIDAIAESESGQWVAGDPDTVGAYEAGDFQKIQALVADLQQIYQRLAPAFMYGNNVRDAERVTAEEVREVANEADQALGGVYSLIADGMHVPLAHILCAEVNPNFVKEVLAGGLTLSVLTGVAALGRSSDVNKLLQIAQILSTVLPVLTQGSQRIDPERVIQKVFEGFGLNLTDYSRTEEELKAMQAQAAQPPASPVGTDLSQVAGAISQQGAL